VDRSGKVFALSVVSGLMKEGDEGGVQPTSSINHLIENDKRKDGEMSVEVKMVGKACIFTDRHDTEHAAFGRGMGTG